MWITLPETARTLTVQSEAQLLLGNINLCRRLAECAFALVGDDQVTEPSLHTIIVRAEQNQGDLAGAHRALTQVVNLLERLDDSFGLARAKTNLVSVLIPLDRSLDASICWRMRSEYSSIWVIRLGLK